MGCVVADDSAGWEKVGDDAGAVVDDMAWSLQAKMWERSTVECIPWYIQRTEVYRRPIWPNAIRRELTGVVDEDKGGLEVVFDEI